METTKIETRRVYECPLPSGYRVLAERLWPRGLRKSDLDLAAWPKDLAPSTELRQWFGHDPERWEEFRQRYWEELQSHRDIARQLLEDAKSQPILLLYAAHDQEHNGALVLRDFLRQIGAV
ncbi:DUF488 family protein [Acidithiobacillus sp. CV18-2]|uniref:DUF488 family protein n=1 Tax=Igneacidithiobacillus copahuensis TaxID=2724909 RepID=A0AAE2YM75_9PROT|nr:DUF488 family protein [Acidithiobacillus sp. CV18-3]MBU2758157.1 DUF488 family protein [Acidithiobacillus sp. BN09-2]MBU2778417.1 DUF488 family protein [Acidithiobacillus sp. CV18-2]MBU2786659.1 DUF488 family protein [Igneacidithiobacillus copahuensis]MBU2796084.1 DUF488 family protein [Acidithiobacillus sp. VAN18-2]MBU2799960.1 DUF488 family protein [Acidithiobacillus sp. VAN18-4]UTV80356.1 DUF488 family protein [Acidithiobacillus sp. YTS05]